MTKRKKNSWKSNIVFIGIFALIMFTPLGFNIRVFMANLISFTPSVEDIEDQIRIENFNWTLVNDHGKQVNFKSSQGKVIVLNFWATWCPPCMAELPELHELYTKFKDHPKVDFYFVSNEDKMKVQEVLKDNNVNIPSYIALSTPPSELRSKSLPTTFVIGKEGKIKIQKIGAANWSSEEMFELILSLTEL